MKMLIIVLAIALVLVGIVGLSLPSLAAAAHMTLPNAPAFRSGDSGPTTCIACFPSPCDCWPDC